MLNQFLMPENSPIAINQGAQDFYSFDYNNERGVISDAKIKTLSFDVISGGTATLGGRNNGNGLLSVSNSSGSEIVNISNTGININNGSLNIYNSSGSIVFDAAGVVSTTNFLNSNVSYGTTQTFSGTTYGTLSNSQSTIILTRNTNILFFINGPMYLNESVGNTGNAVVFINIDGFFENSGGIFIFSGNNYRQTKSISYLKLLGAGTHTINAIARMETINAGTPSLTISDYTLGYIRLGN